MAARIGQLVLVATPIGNVADLSPRAIETLKAADVICAEDTRHTRPLLERVGIMGARLLSVHAHNERERAAEVAALVHDGKTVAFVSDAGCPGVSDPGGRLVEAMVQLGHRVNIVPGPSALTAALMGAGVDVSRVAFLGFLPRKGKERERLVKSGVAGGFALVIYEAANRTDDLLDDLHTWCGPRRVVVARELTKMHETFHRGTLGTTPLSPPMVEKGEVVVVVEAADAVVGDGATVDVASLVADGSLPPKEKARRLAQAQGISVREAYARLQRAQAAPLELVQRALAETAQAAASLLGADDAARNARGEPDDDAEAAGADIVGADSVLRLLNRRSALSAPVEVTEAAKALLSALSALDALVDAMGGAAEDSDDDDDDDDD
jgi:16S rRNA (cytidine1402-2'-O)-methyltransferase